MKEINFNRNWTFWNTRSPEKRSTVHLPHDAMQTENRQKGLTGGCASGFYPGGSYIYEKRFMQPSSWIGKSILLEFDGVYMDSSVFLNGTKIGGEVYGYSQFTVDLSDHLLPSEENVLRVEVDNTRTPNSRWYSGSGIYRDVRLYVGEKKHIRHQSTQIETVSVNPARLRVRTMLDGSDGAGHYTLDLSVRELGILGNDDYGYRTPQDYESLIESAPAVLTETIFVERDRIEKEFVLEDVNLWSADHPSLYVLELALCAGSEIIDRETVRFGIRKLTWNAGEGFCVNGESIKLRGGCIHHDNGMLGACEFRKAAYRRISILKAAGFNAVRMSHHPMSRVLLEACDELGMYVYDESFDMWENSKNDYDFSMYFQKLWAQVLSGMVKKDFNHPCVILYGIGNEITDMTTSRGRRMQQKMISHMHALDPTRPVTNACIGSLGFTKAKSSGEEKTPPSGTPQDTVDPYREDGGGKVRGSLLINIIVTWMPFFSKLTSRADKTYRNASDVIDALDIAGFNYANQMVDELSRMKTDALFLNTETYPRAIGENWSLIRNNSKVVGDFMWTAWDYLGETGVGLTQYNKKIADFNKPYPCVSAGIGAVDMTGDLDAQGAYARAVWHQTSTPYIGVRPVNHSGEKYSLGQWRGTDTVSSWSWEGCEGKHAEAEIYSDAPIVELILNGSSLGRKRTELCKAHFDLAYQPGELTAIAYSESGKVLGKSTLKSAGSENRLNVYPEQKTIRADGEDLAYIVIEIADNAGIKKALSDSRVHVEVSGAGTLAGLGSGNPETTDPFTGPECMSYYGRALAIVRSNGEKGAITVRVTSPGMSPAEIMMEAE